MIQETLPECRKSRNTLKVCRQRDGSSTTSTQVMASQLHRSSRMWLTLHKCVVHRPCTPVYVPQLLALLHQTVINLPMLSAAYVGSTDVGHRESNRSRPSTTATTTPIVVGLTVSVNQLTAVVHADDGLGHQNGRWRPSRTPLRRNPLTTSHASNSADGRRQYYDGTTPDDGLTQNEQLTTTVHDVTVLCQCCLLNEYGYINSSWPRGKTWLGRLTYAWHFDRPVNETKKPGPPTSDWQVYRSMLTRCSCTCSEEASQADKLKLVHEEAHLDVSSSP